MSKSCFCECHEYPGAYPTSEARPCWSCGHVHLHGEMVGGHRDGWRKKDDPDTPLLGGTIIREWGPK